MADLSTGTILRLHTRAQMQGDDLYTFLKRGFPQAPVEERLQYLAAILNDYFEEYRKGEGEIRDGGYRIARFLPKGTR
ncbi:hypothetical protein [Nitratifractor sp.]